MNHQIIKRQFLYFRLKMVILLIFLCIVIFLYIMIDLLYHIVYLKMFPESTMHVC
jgi:hypothetical protein